MAHLAYQSTQYWARLSRFPASGRSDVRDRHTVAFGEAFCDQRAVTGLRVKLDAEQGRDVIFRERFGEWLEIDLVEYLQQIAPGVFRSELGAGALPHPEAIILAVLNLAQLGRRCQLPVMLICDPGIGKRVLQALRVRPGVLGPAHSASLANVEQPANPCGVQGRQKAVAVKSVDPDRCQLRHDYRCWSKSTGAGCRPADGQQLELVEECGDRGVGLADELHVGEALERLLEEDPQLQPGEGRAEAE